VGFQADPSDVEITFEFVDLAHYIKFLAPAFFKKNTFSQHENAHFITFFNTCIPQSRGIINGLSIVGLDNDEYFHDGISFKKTLFFILC